MEKQYIYLETPPTNWEKIDINIDFRNTPLEIREKMWKESMKKTSLILRKIKKKDASIFTEEYNDFDGRLLTKETIYFNKDKSTELSAQWDCGATYSSISNEAARKLGLKPIGKQATDTIFCTQTTNIYEIGLVLRNTDIYIPLVVSGTPNISKAGIDLLIGMDIIKLGDFAISSYKGKTCFSFRVPSFGLIDFTKTRKIR